LPQLQTCFVHNIVKLETSVSYSGNCSERKRKRYNSNFYKMFGTN